MTIKEALKEFLEKGNVTISKKVMIPFMICLHAMDLVPDYRVKHKARKVIITKDLK